MLNLRMLVNSMGKVRKARLHQSLAEQILEANAPRPKSRSKVRKRKPEQGEFVGEKLTHEILQQARQQQEELEEEYGVAGTAKPTKRKRKKSTSGAEVSLDPPGRRGSDAEEFSEGSDFEVEDGEYVQDYCPKVSEEDEEAIKRFMHEEKTPRKTLADVIMDKIRDKETEIASQMSDTSLSHQMDDKVVAVFKGVGQILSKYRSGKLPKAFKFIPSLGNWEEVLYMTEPDKWSAAAMFQATRIFTSNLSTAKAQYFFNLVLLPRIRDDISEFKRLNFHLYMSLKKALFKPAAFFKGLLLPLCESGTCTLREALIVSSVLAKCSIPMLHSSAALLKIAEAEYSGANSIFIRTLLDKKYALPYRVIDALVFHFLRFKTDTRTLPVLWHQSLLTFVQRYKEDMSVEQKEEILDLVRSHHTHHDISAEVRREIVNSKCRDLGVIFNDRNTQPKATAPTTTAAMQE